MDRISVADARKVESIGKHVKLQGWVRTRRDSKGGFSFLELNDGSSQGNVQPPIITASDCEGAGEMFKVTTLDLANVPLTPNPSPQGGEGGNEAPLAPLGRGVGGEGRTVDYTKDFFHRPAFLTVSGQLEA